MKNFIRKYPPIIYISLWVTVAVIHFFILKAAYGMSGITAAIDSLVFNLLFALLGSGLWFMVRFSDLQRKSTQEIIIYHVTGCAITILVWFGLGQFILGSIFADNSIYQVFLRDSVLIRILSGIFIYIILVSIFYLVISFRELREKMEHEARLTALLKEAELSMLRSQIRPHFLFNSLNSISSLTMTNPGKAQEMVIKLSEFMRYSLNLPDSMVSTLEKELYHAELYLDIEKVRFGERLQVEKKIDPAVSSLHVPVMILQPLLENAVKHGVYESTEPRLISIEANMQDDTLVINIRNAYDPESVPKKGTGTGLKNISARLVNIYGRSDLMKISKDDRYFEVILRLPKDAR